MSTTINLQFSLYPQQTAIFNSPADELLVCGQGGGKSYGLLATALLEAARIRNGSLALIHPSRHLEDLFNAPNGFKTLLLPAIESDTIRVDQKNHCIKFANNSIIYFVALDRPADLRRMTLISNFDRLYVDDAHRISVDQFAFFENKLALGAKIVIAALKKSSWVAYRWSSTRRDQKLREEIMTANDMLPERLLKAIKPPLLTQFLDSLGIPWLCAGSAWRNAPHVEKILDVLQRWIDGEWSNIMILMSSRLGKTLSAECAAAYLARYRPSETIGFMSYNEEKAEERSRMIQVFYRRSGGLLMPGANSVQYWMTPDGGGLWAASPQGAHSGNPMQTGFIDEPEKDVEAAQSPAIARRLDQWREFTWKGREDKLTGQPLRQMIITTRNGPNDAVGRWLAHDAKAGIPWHVLPLPAIYDPSITDYYINLAPDNITVEPDYRSKPGEPLSLGDYGIKQWNRSRLGNPWVFAARDQQMPEDITGAAVVDQHWLIDLSEDPAIRSGCNATKYYRRQVRGWDLAATPNAGDWTACVLLGDTSDNRTIIRHAAKARFGASDVLRLVAGVMLLDGPQVTIGIPKDPAAAGIQQLARIAEYLRKIATMISIPCDNCGGRDCAVCEGTGNIRWGMPLIVPVQTKPGLKTGMQLIGDRARPVTSGVEGTVDYVTAKWAPQLRDVIPWWPHLLNHIQNSSDRAELIAIEQLLVRVMNATDGNIYWQSWQDAFLLELHSYPHGAHDDWCAALVYGAQILHRPISIYPETQRGN